MDVLKKYFGFDIFKGNQEVIICNLFVGNDIFVLMFMGGGKLLCYQLLFFIMDGIVIVIFFLIVLMKNQVDVMCNFSEEDGVVYFINLLLNKLVIDQVKLDILSGKIKLFYVVFEFLIKEENVDFLKGVKILFYVVDEVYCILEWGYDFCLEYCCICFIINEIGKVLVIVFIVIVILKVCMDI